ncbi:hypothetical protein BG015_005244 [Linnemannia schmuckeri]|uniref:Kazal-like domain-containing protein n=1 Tax=Linnemannia schmuckeri TaxID=64567 RepID=A0A9P5VCI5_9FUNG|nr:hypothetical protein BG015_005244 [Linnemannia schmuckeri]
MQFYSLITLAVAASMAVLSAMAAPAALKCPDVCAAVYQPICAQNLSGDFITFGNSCELNKYTCHNPDAQLTVAYKGACESIALEKRAVAPKCDLMCVMVDDPVCATSKDGKTQTFSNACLLDVHNCLNPTATFKLVANAACPAAPVCADACPAVYQPVCAKVQSGKTKTFGNKCELSAFNCKNPNDAFTFVSEGAC